MSFISPEETRLRRMEAQARWEVEGVQRGITRYREIVARRPTDEAPPAQRLLRDLLPPLAAEIVVLQSRAADGLLAEGRQPYWYEPITQLSAVEWAVVALKTTLRGALDGQETVQGSCPSSVRSISLSICEVARDQIEYNKLSQDARMAAKTKDGAEHFDLFRVIQSRNPDMNRTTWAKTRKKLELKRDKPWSKEAKITLGVVLLDALLRVAGGALEARLETIDKGRTERRVFLSDATKELLDDRAARAEVARPLLLPMISEPNPWRYE